MLAEERGGRAGCEGAMSDARAAQVSRERAGAVQWFWSSAGRSLDGIEASSLKVNGRGRRLGAAWQLPSSNGGAHYSSRQNWIAWPHASPPSYHRSPPRDGTSAGLAKPLRDISSTSKN